ncbi:MAG: phosphoribosylformylglycinamidine cyclo-ligase [Deltaproteobacteria bacterium CG11_big_fil_rev_8_21_14_0_20_49_13]|nr:MAG: phosphoribosylformylglycinamidine cyclo-ligase [Deltaproteobacteria bacterium CG11_big_fil_rev_8_21_14_0_20_49_13]
MPQTYKNAGVDIDAGDHFIDLIAPAAKSTYRKEVLGGVGPFAASFAIDLKKYKEPVLVSSTDGVGTKLKVAIDLGRYDTIGQDLVAMCVNDLICCGAEPLFFLDYFAMGVLKPKDHAPVIEGIARACKYCNCSLIGGETAEMPGMYHGKDFDLAGFSVGVVDKEMAIDGSKVKEGDVLIGVASSGAHSNGYSLVRKVIADSRLKWTDKFEGKTLADLVLEPTKLYPPLVLRLLSNHESRITNHGIKAIAHITGGGLDGNVPRVVPEDLTAIIKIDAWKRPLIFRLLQEKGNVAEEEMRRVFNLGIGLVLAVDKNSADEIQKSIEKFGERCYKLGHIEKRKDKEIIFI